MQVARREKRVLTRVTRAQSITEAIRQMILSGELKAGLRLQAQMLADRLQVSRTPVMEALSALHKEGLLEYEPNRGYSTKSFGLPDILHAFDVRMTLEGLACRLLAERGLNAEQSVRLRTNLAASSEMLFGPHWGSTEQSRWAELNLEFHDLIVHAASNPYLTAGIASTRSLPSNYRTGVLWPLDRSRQSFRDHERVAAALLSGQGRHAENMMVEHIFASREEIRNQVESRV